MTSPILSPNSLVLFGTWILQHSAVTRTQKESLWKNFQITALYYFFLFSFKTAPPISMVSEIKNEAGGECCLHQKSHLCLS